jgi:epoxyqueuosine reductase
MTLDEVRRIIGTFVDSPANVLGAVGCEGAVGSERCWGEPLVAVSRGDDRLWGEIKDHVGGFYWTPLEAFQADHPGLAVAAEVLAVISWVLPQTESTRADNRRETRLPAERWARAKHDGERINRELRAHLVDELVRAGVPATAPVLSPDYFESDSPAWGRAARWSERHAAFVAGLGTFGLCDGLITAAGKAHRCGSVVALLETAPAQRPYGGTHDYCLFFARGTCGACIKRCPAGALSESGHDKQLCSIYLDKMDTEHIGPKFGFSTGACGLCQTRVPCESRIPIRAE